MARVELKGIGKVYEGGTPPAVKDANFVVEDREFVVLVGPSGCGKSTTLRMIAGLEVITEGELYIDGEPMNNVPAKDRNIAMVFQSYALYPHMSVYENMAFGLKMRKIPKDEIDQRVKKAAATLAIEKLLDRKPKLLSGGQRQRVAVGRAIVREPKVFLFDEPLSNLDAKLRVQMRAELSKLHRDLNATIIYVTHDQVEAMTMADKIVVMKDGIVQQIGSPLHLYNHPCNKFVAGFIGSPPMNFLIVTVREEEGSIVLDEGSFIAKPDAAHVEFLNEYIGKEIFFGIRPEDMDYVESGGENSFASKVVVVEPLGADIHLGISTATQSLVARTAPHHLFKFDEVAHFILRMDKARYFDKESELAILPGSLQ